MKSKHFSRVMAVVLAVAMLMSMFSVTAFASIANWSENNVVFSGSSFGTNGYYNVISKKDYTLVPGAATETEMVLNNNAGTRRQVMHIIELDPSNPDVSVLPGYYNIDKLQEDPSDVSAYMAAGVTNVAAYYENPLGYQVVGAMNTDLDYSDNAPRVLVYNGQILSGYAKASAPNSVLYVWNNSGEISCEVTDYSKAAMEAGVANGTLLHAISVSFAMVVRDGELVSKNEERTSESAARSLVGVKEDGTLVLVMNDGRNANNSKGFCNYELGESMLALGCKWAANCDGGGSSSFVTRRAGEDDLVCRCVPCDGAERPTKSSVVVVSNVAPTGVFDQANVTADYDCFAPGTTYTFKATALDTHGYAMDMPADATWALSDDSFGTIDNGTFVSNGKLGEVDVQVISSGNVVGSKTITVANPTTLELSSASTILPYSTSEKPRKVELPIVATIGEQKVFFDSACFNVTSSVAQAGTINGLSFTATTDESIASTVLTIEYLPTSQKLNYTITFGKGSDILWDFEDGDISNWYGGSKDVKEWLTANGVAEGDQLKTLISGGQISYSEQSHTFLSTRENGGQVHNGNNALGVDFDFRNVEFNSWVYAILYNVQDQYVLRDVANGKNATALGMWCYVPEGFCNPAGDTTGALAMQLTVYKNPQGTSGGQLHFQFYSEAQKKRVSLNQCTEADIPENRWVYLTADLTGSDYYSLTNPKGTSYREPSFLRMYIKPTRSQVLTYYFDEFTLDYSSAVDDRDAPVITNTTYCLVDTNTQLNNQTINTNTVSFDANIADYAASNSEGLNYDTAAIYADGVKLKGVTASGNTMGVKNVVLSNGTHAIKFEIYDNAGNFSSVTKYITVDADATKAVVSIAGHNDKNNVPESDSVYYVDLIASDIAQISSVTTTLKLNTANTWELDHMIPAAGYEATYSYNEISKLATITVTKVGNNDLTGEQTLVSIPARIWSFDESTDVGGDGTASTFMTTTQRFNSSYGEPKVFVDVKVVSGAIDYTDKTVGTFGGNISVATKLVGNKSNGMWHQHTAYDMDDAAATCTEAGYTGRTYCDVCGSVVDWGTTIPATGHNYVLNNGVFACSDCDAEYDYSGVTGLFEVDGKTYYAIAGKLVKGWQQIEDDWYYFDATTYTGVETLNNGYVTFEFDETGKLLEGKWYTDDNGTKYYYGPGFHKGTPSADTWVTIDGNRYCFDRNGYIFKNYHYVNTPNSPIYRWYDFGNDGVLVGEWDYTGTYSLGDNLYYIENGVSRHGMFMMDGNYYYAGSANYYAALKNTSYNCTDTHKLLPIGVYTFGPDGKMLVDSFFTENDILYYYVLGQKATNIETVEINNEFVAVDNTGKVCYTGDFADITGEVRHYVDGVVTYIPKNGVVDDYYYIDDVRVGAYYGLVESDGYFYYVNDGGKIVKNTRKYVNKTNDLTFADGTPVPRDYFEFDEDGKMVVLNGVVGDRFYINGTLTPAYYGLVESDGYFYYVNDGGRIVKNMRKYVNKTNDLTFADGTPVPRDYFEFDEDGKMIVLNGIVDDYAYINGSKMGAYYGLVEFGGYFYYVNDGGKIVKNMRKYVNKTNDLTFANGDPVQREYFEFDEDGKMIVLNGIIDDYAYINGVRMGSYYGLVEFDGYFYYVNDGGKIVKNVRKYVNKTNDLTFANGTDVPRAYFEFDADGKMIVD